jgi:uncharacterized protein (UPF0332 family)
VKPETASFLDKAFRAIEAAELMLENGYVDFAASRAYYAMFYTATALLQEQGLSGSKQSRVHALFGEHFAKTGRLNQKFHRWLLTAFDARLEGDYAFDAALPTEETTVLIDQAREFLDVAKRFLMAS